MVASCWKRGKIVCRNDHDIWNVHGGSPRMNTFLCRAHVFGMIFFLSSSWQVCKLVESWVSTTGTVRCRDPIVTALAAQGPLRKPIRRSPSAGSSSIRKDSERQEQIAEARKRHQEALKDPTLLSNTTFDDPLLALEPPILRAVTHTLNLQRLTEIQAKTWPYIVAGHSIVGRAQTGTGKTFAYLIPGLQRLLQANDPAFFRPGRTLGLLVVAPTRELAIQARHVEQRLWLIADQAKLLLTHVRPAWTVQCAYGGTKISRDRAFLLQKGIPAVLVVTPGRMLDLVEQKTRTTGTRLLADVLKGTPIVVLDEADRLLEAFPKETLKILSLLPRTRQTMLFSATFPRRWMRGDDLDSVLANNFTVVDCINDKNSDKKNKTVQRNSRIAESYVQLSDMRYYFTGLTSIVSTAIDNSDGFGHSKILFFFPTAKLVKLVAEMLMSCGIVDSSSFSVLQIHSRMSQAARNRASTQFRQSKNAILLTSDVSARGVDYPGVSLVVQYGAPYSMKLYLHRLGRTGRAGNARGNGLVVLLPFETSFRSLLKKRGVAKNTDSFADFSVIDPSIEDKLSGFKQLVKSSHPVIFPCAEAACISFVAHYLEYAGKGINCAVLADAARGLAMAMGLKEVPSLPDEMNGQLKLGD